MKKALLLLVVLAATAFSQTAPSAYTTNYRIRQWASGANPSADSLNANWALIDSTIRYPRYINVDTLKAFTSRKIRIGSGDGLDTLTVYGPTDIVGALTAGSATVEQYLSTGSAGGVDGGVRIYNALNGYYLELFGTAATSNKILTLPNIAGTVGLVDGDQDFTDMGTIKPDSIHSGGGARIDGFVDINATLQADSLTIGLMAIGGGDIFKDGSAYTNPDYVFQDHYTGESSNPSYEGLRPLDEVEAYTKENHRLPGIKDEPTGIFSRADFLLENVEKLYLYVIAQDKELRRLRAELESMKRK